MTSPKKNTNYVTDRDLSPFVTNPNTNDPNIVCVKIGELDMFMHKESNYLDASALFRKFGLTYADWRYCNRTKRIIEDLKERYNVTTKDLIFLFESCLDDVEDEYTGYYVYWDLVCDIFSYISPSHNHSAAKTLLDFYSKKVSYDNVIDDVISVIAKREEKTNAKIDELTNLIKGLISETKPTVSDDKVPYEPSGQDWYEDDYDEIIEIKPKKKVPAKKDKNVMLVVDNYYIVAPSMPRKKGKNFSVICCTAANSNEKFEKHKKKYPRARVIHTFNVDSYDHENIWIDFADVSRDLIYSNRDGSKDFSLHATKSIGNVLDRLGEHIECWFN